MPEYIEKEIFEEVLLCDRQGGLNPGAVAWSRKPLHIANMRGNWPRKKKWNHWVITSDTFSFCASLSNIDYIGLAHAYFLDFATGELIEHTVVLPLGLGCRLPERLEQEAYFKNRKIMMRFKYNLDGLSITVESRQFGGEKLSADIQVHIPAEHESVNVAIPFGRGKYRYTSKQTALPASGAIRIGNREYQCNPDNTFASLDYNRSIFDYRTNWNWANAAGRRNGNSIGLNFGSRWRNATTLTQNGICFNGIIHKISEDILFTYNSKDYMEPWIFKTEKSNRVNLTLTPFYEKLICEDFAIIKTHVHQVYGTFSGTIELDDKTTISIKDLIGWSEEQNAKW
jgi:hypothetical protein